MTIFHKITVTKGQPVVLFYSMTLINALAIFLSGYFIGNFSPSYLCGRINGKLDIREHGSGNAGATNVIRVLGWRYGVVVFILDAIKGAFAAILGMWLAGPPGAVLAAFGVVLGHDFPVFLNFRGGKGVAATTGIFLFLFPVPTLIAILIFIAVVRVSGMVSLGSLVFVVSMLIYSLASQQTPVFVLLTTGLVVFAFLRHNENIQRILRDEENKLSFEKKT